jgi:hypothetical protein
MVRNRARLSIGLMLAMVLMVSASASGICAVLCSTDLCPGCPSLQHQEKTPCCEAETDPSIHECCEPKGSDAVQPQRIQAPASEPPVESPAILSVAITIDRSTEEEALPVEEPPASSVPHGATLLPASRAPPIS